MSYSENISMELSMKTFEKIVLITVPEYAAHFEKFINSDNSKISLVLATMGNLDDVASAVQCHMKIEPARTLWLTHTEVFKISQTEKNDQCVKCKEPLEIHILPSMQGLTYSNYANEMQSSFNELIKKIDSLLDTDSSFAILPPFPPSFLPLEETKHDLYHKLSKVGKYYFTTFSALIEFELLYEEINKQMIPFSLSQLRKKNIVNRSIAEYFKVTESWNSYLHIYQYTNTKYNQWLKYINKFLSDALKPSSAENISEKENSLKDFRVSSDSDKPSDIHMLDNVQATSEDAELERIIDLGKPISPESYDHIVIICFNKAHAQLLIEQEQNQNISIVVVKSTLNWSEEREKFDGFAQVYKTVLFIVMGSITLLEKEYPEPFCESEMCTNPLICLNLSLNSNDKIVNKGIELYKLFISNIRKHFENLNTNFILTPFIPLKCTPKPHITNTATHSGLHKVLSDMNIYLMIGGIERWSALANAFQEYYYSRLLKECHTMYEIRIFDNILKDFTYTSKSPIIWIKLSKSSIAVDTPYDEGELKLFIKKFIYSIIKHKKRSPACSDLSGVQEVIVLSKDPRLKLEESELCKSCVIKILLGRHIVDFISKEKSLEKLQEDAKCEITTTIERYYFPGTRSRVCLITGTEEEVLKALFIIINIINFKTPKIVEVRVKFVVPDCTAKLLVGEKEENLKQIMLTSKTKMTIYSKERCPSKESCFLVKSFNVDHIKTAFSLILAFIVLDQGSGMCNNVTYPFVSLSASGLCKTFDNTGVNEEMMVPEPTIENVEENKVCHFKILLSYDVIEALIGDNGEALQNLQKDTNSKITISKNFEYFPGSEKRVCLITGTVDVVFKVLFIIIDIIKNVNLKTFNRYVEFVVPDSTARLIIGEKEENLHQIRAKSQAYVRMYRKENYPSPNESCFVVKDFHMGNIATAFSMILNKIALDPENGSFSDITYQQFSPASNLIEVPYIEDSDSSVITKDKIVELTTIPQLKPDTSKDNVCHLKILLENDIAKIVNDDNGEALGQLQKDTNSKITISKDGEYFPHTCRRVFSICGTFSDVLTAVFLIIDIKKAFDGKDNRVKFVVPDSTAIMITGEGKSIEQIQKTSKAFVRLYNKEDYPSSSESVFVVNSYDIENIKVAVSLILQHIVLDPENGSCNSISYPRTLPSPVLSSDKTLANKGNRISSFSTTVADRKQKLKLGVQRDAVLSYSNFAGADSQYNYPVTSACPSTQATSTYSTSVTQDASDHSSKQEEVSEHQLRLSNGYPESNVENCFSSTAGQESYSWNNYNYWYQTNENYNNCAGVSQYSYEYVASGYQSSCVTSEYPSTKTINQMTIDKSSNQEDSTYSSRSLANRYPENSGQLADPSEKQRVNDHESRNQVASGNQAGKNQMGSRSPSGDSRPRSTQRSRPPSQYNYSRSRRRRSHRCQSRSMSPKPKSSSSSKRFRSRSRSLDDRPYSRKRSHKSSRRRNYRKRSRSYSRSRSKSDKSSSNCRDRESHSSNRNRSPSRTDNESIHHESDDIGDEFSVSGAINLLERVCDKCGTLSGWIKTFTTSIKAELKIDRNKALRLIENDNDFLPLKMIASKLKSCISSAPKEDIGLLTKAADWTTYLIEYIEKSKKPERNINLRAIAQASLNKTNDFIVNLIKTAFLYEFHSNPAEEDIREAFVKVSELQFQIVMEAKQPE